LRKHAEHNIHNESILSEGHEEEDDMYKMSSEDICPHNFEKCMNLVNKVLFIKYTYFVVNLSKESSMYIVA